MKKLSYLFAILGLFAFTACGGASEGAAEEATEVAICGNTGEPCLDDHSCCVVKEETVDHDHSDDSDHGHDHSDGSDHGHDHE